MNSIDRFPTLSSASVRGPSSPARPGGADEFRRAIDATDHATASTPALACSAVSPMLLHELRASEARRRDRQARQRGKELLQALAALQRAALGIDDPEAARAQIADLLASMPEANDPALASVLRQIEVRAAVEASRPRYD